jgi:hypothetical protein
MNQFGVNPRCGIGFSHISRMTYRGTEHNGGSVFCFFFPVTNDSFGDWRFGDKKALRPVFSNVSDQITLAELIQSGHLVPPRTYVVDVGTQNELSQVKRTADDFDMDFCLERYQ